MTRLDLSENQLSGAIPPELSQLSNLVILVLSDNQLRGTVPKEFANFVQEESDTGRTHKLRELFLHGNSLTGCVSEGLAFIPRVNDSGLTACPSD